MRIYYVFLALLCSSAIYAMAKKSCPHDEVMFVINQYLTPLEEEKGIELRGYGLHYAGPDKVYDGKIHEINLGLSISKKMKYEEARTLFYSVVDGLLQSINKNESIRNHFYNHPVTYQDLYFRLSFDYEAAGYLDIGDISMIAILENKIKYFIVEEKRGNVAIGTRKTVPHVYIGTGFPPKTRCVTKKLPEEATND